MCLIYDWWIFLLLFIFFGVFFFCSEKGLINKFVLVIKLLLKDLFVLKEKYIYVKVLYLVLKVLLIYFIMFVIEKG